MVVSGWLQKKQLGNWVTIYIYMYVVSPIPPIKETRSLAIFQCLMSLLSLLVCAMMGSLSNCSKMASRPRKKLILRSGEALSRSGGFHLSMILLSSRIHLLMIGPCWSCSNLCIFILYSNLYLCIWIWIFTCWKYVCHICIKWLEVAGFLKSFSHPQSPAHLTGKTRCPCPWAERLGLWEVVANSH